MRMKIGMWIIAGALLMAAGPVAIPTVEAETYQIDGAHTSAIFLVLHRGFSRTIGRFNEIAGSVVFDENDFSKSAVNVTIKTESVDTNQKKRDDHLRSPDFFNSKEFPEMTFKSTGVKQTGDKTGQLMGELTLLGVTKPVTLDVTFNRVGPSGREKIPTCGFSAQTKIKRTDFGMTYGLQGIGEEVEILIEAEAQIK